MKLLKKYNASSVLAEVFIADSSALNGGGLTGLAYNTSNITSYYYRSGDTSAISFSLASTSIGTWSSGGFVEVNSTGMPGIYQIGIPNAVFTNQSSSQAIVYINGGTAGTALSNRIVAAPIEIQLSSFDPAVGVNLDQTTLPELSQGLQPVTPTIQQALMLTYMMERNQMTTTSSTSTFSNNAGTVISKWTLTDDGTTFIKSQMISGP